MVFGTLRVRSLRGGCPKGTSRNLDFVGNLPRSSKIFTEFVVGFLWIPFGILAERPMGVTCVKQSKFS